MNELMIEKLIKDQLALRAQRGNCRIELTDIWTNGQINLKKLQIIILNNY